ncbi:hypothetical protein BH686_01375 [Rhodococcus erythropolis]|nr:hypothetical protein BH686_01375 [Rhodococcus erythropolis]
MFELVNGSALARRERRTGPRGIDLPATTSAIILRSLSMAPVFPMSHIADCNNRRDPPGTRKLGRCDDRIEWNTTAGAGGPGALGL